MRRYDEDIPNDLGFELPDDREIYYLKDRSQVTVTIVRDWFHNEETNASDYKVSWTIKENGQPVILKQLKTQEDASRILKSMYRGQIDRAASRELTQDAKTMAMEMGMRSLDW